MRKGNFGMVAGCEQNVLGGEQNSSTFYMCLMWTLFLRNIACISFLRDIGPLVPISSFLYSYHLSIKTPCFYGSFVSFTLYLAIICLLVPHVPKIVSRNSHRDTF
jgi:hypothetical protein